MSLRFYTPLLFFIFSLPVFSQENFSTLTISSNLKENANAVVRYDRTDIEISSRKSMNVLKRRVVTVYNESGLGSINAAEYFDEATSVKSIEAHVYNSMGEEIKKIKKKDFKEQSATGSSIITDSRIIYLDYTPVQYPFTIVYESEIQSSNTAFIPSWNPAGDFYTGIEKSVFTIQYNPELGFRHKEYNFENLNLIAEEAGNKLSLSIENIPAFKHEEYMPYAKILPKALFSLSKFTLEEVEGQSDSWESFGLWMYNTLLTGTDELSEETVAKIKNLTSSETDTLKKARMVYEYMQSKTRYISIQLGIGGWKPMTAMDVDRLGYGDCKALSNYTRALLKAVGIDSYYTIIYAGGDKNDIRSDFVSMQGNHAILAIPYKGDYVWLECTSQTIPFGFQGRFTDDRLALLVKPEGGEVVRTHVYEEEENSQFSKGSYTITAGGGITGQLNITSKGTQYDTKYYLVSKSEEDLHKRYKSYFGNINNLKLTRTDILNDKKSLKFTEDISLEAEDYCSTSGNRIMFVVNAFNQYDNVPQRYRKRINPFEVDRGFHDFDEVVINLPEGFEIEAVPQPVEIKEKFGEYRVECTVVSPSQLLYKRTLITNSGLFEKDDYELYRQFREKIARNDNSKVVLVKK